MLTPKPPYNAEIKTGADANNAFYPWQKTFMFGLDITF